MLLEPEIFVRHMIFIIPKGHSYYTENFRSEAYGLNESHFYGQTLIGSDRPLEPQIFVTQMIFIIAKGHNCYPSDLSLMG